jgi:trans-L-3-hydroxyproline dehydratase
VNRFYAYCKAQDLGVRIIPEEFRKLIEVGMAVKRAVMEC